MFVHTRYSDARRHADHEATAPAAAFTPRQYPPPDGAISFALNDSLYRRSAGPQLPMLALTGRTHNVRMCCPRRSKKSLPLGLLFLWALHAVTFCVLVPNTVQAT